MMMNRVAFFGGSFNPPHWAHRQVLDYLRGLDDFDAVWMAPTYSHPFEKDLAPFEDRFRMCELTVLGLEPRVEVCPIEGELKETPSYTIDVIRALKLRFPQHHFSIVVGSDCRGGLKKWKSYEELKREAAFFFIPRPGLEKSPFLDISSTRIRRLIRQGKPATKYLVPEVSAYIEEKGLYRPHS